jgi:hypothetical protein
MLVTFSCPECGTSIELAPHAAGRKSRCSECLTLVEMPYLPRERRSNRAGNARQWSWVAIVLALVVIASTLVYMIVKNNMQSARRRDFNDLVARASQDEKMGDWDNAVRRLDAALSLAREPHTADQARIEQLRTKRAELASHRDEKRSEIQNQAAEGALIVARAELRQAKPNLNRVLDLCETAHQAAAGVGSEAGSDLLRQANELASSVIRVRGVRLEPVKGSYLDGDQNEAYTKAFFPALVSTAEARGYIVRRDHSPLRRVWDEVAPYKLTTEVTETPGKTYMNSPLLTTRIDAHFVLVAGDREIWQMRMTARTREPSSRFSAYESGYLASATKRDSNRERRLREDAIASATEQLPAKLNTLPAYALASPGG